jgi:hypothetical protein
MKLIRQMTKVSRQRKIGKKNFHQKNKNEESEKELPMTKL